VTVPTARSTEPRPAPVAPAWSLLVAESVTGTVVGRLPMSALSWSRGLTFGSGHVCQPTIPLDGPPRPGDPTSTTDWVRTIVEGGPRFMLVAVYGQRAVTYGFISAPSPAPSGVTIGTLDLAGLLRRRSIIAAGQRLTPASVAADTTLGPVSKPQLARLLLVQALGETGGALPLDVSTPTVTAGTETRTYSGFRLTKYADALLDLADDEDGPDIRVTPVLSVDQQSVTLRVDIGEPYVGAVEVHFDSPGSCADITPDYDMSQMGAYHYVPGDGSDQDKPIGVAYNGDYLAAGVPLMDRVDPTRGTIGDKTVLDGYARANAAVYAGPLESMTLTVSADAEPALGTYAPGDDVSVRTSQHWWYGTDLFQRRIVNVAGDHTSTVTITTAPVPEGVS
jgi:hypothetical protein